MGNTTPNISIYIPSAGETNYDASFSNGMLNVDQHDHSGAPTKGVPIGTNGISNGAITFDKLNSNVFSTGTFTPQLQFGGANVGLTTSSSIGKYWLGGKVVYINIIIVLTNKGSSTGNATISGLPFTSANDGFYNVFTDLSKINNYPAGTTFLSHEVDPNTSVIKLAAAGANNRTALIDTNFANTDEIQLSGFYWIV